MTTDEALKEVEDYVQARREDGEIDLRGILYAIKDLRERLGKDSPAKKVLNSLDHVRQEGPELAPPDGLGFFRKGDAILCQAWGETDRPDAFLAESAADVRQFILTEWIDNENDETLKEVMAELASHDWNDDGVLQYDFELGGISFMDVCAVMPKGKA